MAGIVENSSSGTSSLNCSINSWPLMSIKVANWSSSLKIEGNVFSYQCTGSFPIHVVKRAMASSTEIKILRLCSLCNSLSAKLSVFVASIPSITTLANPSQASKKLSTNSAASCFENGLMVLGSSVCSAYSMRRKSASVLKVVGEFKKYS